MRYIDGYLVIAKLQNMIPYLMYGAPEVEHNEPTEQFLLNGLKPLNDTEQVSRGMRFLEANDQVESIGVMQFKMSLAESIDEIDSLPLHATSVFVSRFEQDDWQHYKIFGPRNPKSTLGFDGRSEITCNGFELYGPATTNPNNRCFWDMSELKRQSRDDNVWVASWEHKWVQVETPIKT